jgi:hypothetical protein
MSRYAPLRDAFSELNKTITDSTTWKSTHDLEEKRMGLQQMQLESSLQDAALRRETLKKDAAIAKDQMSEEVVNIFNLIPNNAYTQEKLFDKTDAGLRFVKALGGVDVDRATGIVFDDYGEPLKMQKWMVGEKTAQNYSLLSVAFDPEEMVKVNIDAATSKIADLERELSKLPEHDIAGRKKLKERIYEGQTTLKEQMVALSPEKLVPLYKMRSDAAMQTAINAATRGVSENSLKSLQEAARLAQADYINAVNKQSAAEMQRQGFTHSEKLQSQQQGFLGEQQKRQFAHAEEMERIRSAKELEKEKQKIAKEAEGTKRIAVKIGNNGQPVGTVDISVPKNAGGVYTPESIGGEDLKGYVWKDQLEMENQWKAQANANTTQMSKNIEKLWSKTTTDEMGKQTETLPEMHRPRFEASLRVADAIMKADPKGLNNPMGIATQAKSAVKAAELDFWRKYEVFEKQMMVAQNISEARLDDETREIFIRKFASLPDKEDGSTFVGDLGYIPNYKYKDTLLDPEKIVLDK